MPRAARAEQRRRRTQPGSESDAIDRRRFRPSSARVSTRGTPFRLLIARPAACYDRSAIPMPAVPATVPMAPPTLPVVTGDKDRSLQEALGRLTLVARARRAGQPTRSSRRPRRLPAVAASFAPYPEGPTIAACAARWRRAAIEQLYTHQAEAFAHVARRAQRRHDHADRVGQDALLQRAGARRDPARIRRRARCICFRPRRSRRISSPSCTRCPSSSSSDGGAEIGVFTYDGDTPSDARRAIRGKAHVVLSNPDMLHSGILPHHPRWAKLFENLNFVVIDELHAYRGVFGSHLVEHPAAAAARLPALRIGSDLHLLVGDDRQSARAGRRADRAAVRAGRRERRAARREVLPVRQSAGRQRASSASGARIWRRRAGSRSSSSSTTCS